MHARRMHAKLTGRVIDFSVAHGARILKVIHAEIGGPGMRDCANSNTAISKYGQ